MTGVIGVSEWPVSKPNFLKPTLSEALYLVIPAKAGIWYFKDGFPTGSGMTINR